MGVISDILKPTDGFVGIFRRDTVNGWWEADIGLPKNWVYSSNDKIKCEVIDEDEKGKLITISPTDISVEFDDLVAFITVIIEINGKIAEKEKEFTNKVEEMKKILEKEAKNFYEELDELKENSFKNLNKQSNESENPEKKETRGRKPKTIIAGSE